MKHLNKMTGIYAIILASGQSKRMGTPKLLLQWKGMYIIEHILSKTISLPFAGLKVVIPKDNESLKKTVSNYPCDPIYNFSPSLGLGYSLSLGIRSLPADAKAAIILLGDQPGIDSEDIQNLCIEYVLNDFCNNKVIMQTKYQDGQIGHPILFSSHFFQALTAASGDRGGKDIIQRNLRFLSICHSDNLYPEDIDTPHDYLKLILEE